MIPPRYARARARLLGLVLLALPAAPARAAGLPFIENDWPRALAEARRRDVAVFVDAWAPW